MAVDGRGRLAAGLLALMIALGASPPGAAADLVDRRRDQDGNRILIDWRAGHLEATGRSGPVLGSDRDRLRDRALMAARAAADRAMVGALNQLRATPQRTLSDLALEGRIVPARLRAAASRAVVVAEEIGWERAGEGRLQARAEVSLRLCWTDRASACTDYGGGEEGLMRVLRLDRLSLTPDAEPYRPTSEALARASEALAAADGPVNSVAIETAALFYRPVLFPQIVTEAGQSVYGPDRLEREALFNRGPARYAKDLDRAREIPIMEPETMVVTALGLDDAGRIVIAEADAARLAAAGSRSGDFLGLARLAVVVP